MRAWSKVALPLLRLHRAFFVVIDEPALSLAALGQEHFPDDLGERGGRALHRAGEWVTPERAETDPALDRLLSRHQPHALVVDHDERAAPLDHEALLREVERNDRHLLEPEVLPH